MLNLVAATAIFAALTCLSAALLVLPLGRVPDWEDLRPLFWVALTAALMPACNIFDTLDVPVVVHLWSDRIQSAAMMFHIGAWISYLPGWAKRPDRLPWWTRAPVLVGVVALLPGVVFSGALVPRAVPWLGVVYQDPVFTPFGLAMAGVVGAAGIGGLVLMARWGRAGAPYPRSHLLALGIFFLVFAHDVLVLAGLPLPTPYLQDLACMGMMIVFGFITLRRISENATEYSRLRGHLEAAVADRSRMLEESQAALARAERLAALGQFSAGVAHEVNNPAAAVAADLQFLAAELAGDPRAEVRSTLDDARAGVQRIVQLARQLLLAGRTASAAAPALNPVNVAGALEPALAAARARADDRAVLAVAVPGALWVRAQPEPLVQILSNLLVNAVQAIPAVRHGTVAVRAEEAGERVRIVVEDDGVGMSEEELRHVFEPFYSTKAPGQGTGLGLAVARSLVEAMQGSLTFESAVGVGTRAILELGRAAAPGEEPERPASTPPPAARATVLVVDDDVQVLRSMARLLGRRHEVFTAPGVKEGVAAVEDRGFDLVLCDVMMPGGGGERFWAELLVRQPSLMNRVVFMTGGAVTREARAFLRRQPRPILAKPFDLTAVDELLNALPRRGGSPPVEAERTAPIGRVKR